MEISANSRDETLYEDKDYDNTFKKSLRRKCSNVIFVTVEICSAIYHNFLSLNWYLLGIEMNLGHVHKTRFRYLIGEFSNFSDEHSPGNVR